MQMDQASHPPPLSFSQRIKCVCVCVVVGGGGGGVGGGGIGPSHHLEAGEQASRQLPGRFPEQQTMPSAAPFSQWMPGTPGAQALCTGLLPLLGGIPGG